MEKPVSKGEIIKSKIIDLSNEGSGIVKIDGYTIFLDGGLIGDFVEFQVYKVKKKFAFGKIKNIIEASNLRVNSNVDINKKNIGCPLEDLKYEEQLKYKQDKVTNNLKRIGGLEEIKILPIIGMERPYRYRNNVQIPVGQENGELKIGFFKTGTNQIVDMDSSIIQAEVVDDIIKQVRKFMQAYNIEAYNYRTRKGVIKHIIIRNSIKGDTMIVLVSKTKTIKNIEILTDMLIKTIPSLKTVVHNINDKNTNRVLGDKFQVLYGQGYIYDYIDDYKFKISPSSFFQVNPIQTKHMYGLISEYLNLDKNDRVVDLYCGTGTIGISLAKNAKEVIGVEIVESAIEDANHNMKLNKIDNIKFICGLSEEVFPKLIKEKKDIDALIVDPPRKGLDSKVIDSILDIKPQKIVYVSCDPATLSRDLSILKEEYEIKKVQPIDMFPHTTHVECISLIQRKTI